MTWYDGFSHVYDASIEWLYRPYRDRIAKSLDLSRGQTVVDLACGTGQNFASLESQIGQGGRLIGVDLSKGMLRRAARRVEASGWSNTHLLNMDAGSLARRNLDPVGEVDIRPDAVVCTLGLSAMPGWESVLASSFSLLKRGGTFAIFDVFAEKWVPQTSVVGLVARADLKRQSWKSLKALSSDFQMSFLEGSPHLHGGRLFLARGIRGDSWDTGDLGQALALARSAVRGGESGEDSAKPVEAPLNRGL